MDNKEENQQTNSENNTNSQQSTDKTSKESSKEELTKGVIEGAAEIQQATRLKNIELEEDELANIDPNELKPRPWLKFIAIGMFVLVAIVFVFIFILQFSEDPDIEVIRRVLNYKRIEDI